MVQLTCKCFQYQYVPQCIHSHLHGSFTICLQADKACIYDSQNPTWGYFGPARGNLCRYPVWETSKPGLRDSFQLPFGDQCKPFNFPSAQNRSNRMLFSQKERHFFGKYSLVVGISCSANSSMDHFQTRRGLLYSITGCDNGQQKWTPSILSVPLGASDERRDASAKYYYSNDVPLSLSCALWKCVNFGACPDECEP